MRSLRERMNKLRILLFPFSLIYGLVVYLRNILYAKGWFKSHSPDVKTIIVGNLALGGTGKTPHLEYLLKVLSDKQVSVLSRGYGRTTTGNRKLSAESTVSEVGDEPIQMAQKFKGTSFWVDENRVHGIQKIMEDKPNTDVVLLDDALQHRQLKAGLNLLLTTFDQPFVSDLYLPAGNLRDHKIRAYDADAIIVTKCPKNVDKAKRAQLEKRLKKYCPNVFFDALSYREPSNLFEAQSTLTPGSKVLLVSAIAKPEIFEQKARSEYDVQDHFIYRDHYQFKASDIEKIRNFIGRFAPGEISVLTTEKDATRLKPVLNSSPFKISNVFEWGIEVEFLDGEIAFNELIKSYVERPKRNS